MLILLRTSCRPNCLTLIPSIKITPSGSTKRNKTETRDDLPAPVLPTIPIFSWGKTSKDTPRKTGGNDRLYHKKTFSKDIEPSVGQSLEGLLSGLDLSSASGSSFPYSMTLSHETIWVSKSADIRMKYWNHPKTWRLADKINPASPPGILPLGDNMTAKIMAAIYPLDKRSIANPTDLWQEKTKNRLETESFMKRTNCFSKHSCNLKDRIAINPENADEIWS